MVDKIPVSEQDLASFVEDCLDTFGWKWCHSRPARTEKGWRTALTGHKGFPDYCATRQREGDQFSEVLFIELKSEKGELTKEQREWLELLESNPLVGVFCWRPSDWQKICSVLR